MKGIVLSLLCVSAVLSASPFQRPNATASWPDVRTMERARILPAAERFLAEQPVTITASRSARSAGGPHDFFSEGDYWWPDPKDPDGPYIQRDGMSNPDNFVEHRRAMIRLGTIVPTLVSAYRLTGDERYAAHAMKHLRAWFADEATRMAPHLRYAQAIHGRATGRGTGIIDTIHLVEVARSAEWLANDVRGAVSLSGTAGVPAPAERKETASPASLATARSPGAARGSVAEADVRAVKQWFAEYLAWLTTHEYGIAERDAKNNHGTCWVMQVAAFAHLIGDEKLLESCRDRFKQVLVPGQMAPDGSFPLELKRTKPYGYSLFNLDAFATICQILSPRSPSALLPGGRLDVREMAFDENLWTWTLPDGRGMRRALEFLYPYVRDKSRWPFAKDVMYFDQWPVRHPSLLFAGIAFSEPKYLELWSRLEPSPTNEEVIRNLPVRHPLLWGDYNWSRIPR